MACLTADSIQAKAKRYPFLDELRGAAILMMIAYHLLYDGVVFAGWDIPLFSPPLSLWQDSIGALFILLSGCMCRLSRSNWRRGLRCLAAALSHHRRHFFPGSHRGRLVRRAPFSGLRHAAVSSFSPSAGPVPCAARSRLLFFAVLGHLSGQPGQNRRAFLAGKSSLLSLP